MAFLHPWTLWLIFIANLPCGGIKSTGWGTMNSRWGLEEFTRLKTFTANMTSHTNFASY